MFWGVVAFILIVEFLSVVHVDLARKRIDKIEDFLRQHPPSEGE